MSPLALIKNGEGNYTLAVKVVAVLFTAGSVIFASGKLVGTVNEHTKEIGGLKTDVKAVEGRVQSMREGQVRHEVLDSILVNELRDMRIDVKQLLRRR